MTGQMVNCNGFNLCIPNDITNNCLEFYISYNSRDVGSYGDVTTALVLTEKDNPTKFLILNGNHTKAYNEIIAAGGGYEGCLEYFKNNLDKKSEYSENWDETLIIHEDGSLSVVKTSEM